MSFDIPFFDDELFGTGTGEVFFNIDVIDEAFDFCAMGDANSPVVEGNFLIELSWGFDRFRMAKSIVAKSSQGYGLIYGTSVFVMALYTIVMCLH
jgi:hypothetical protein